MGWNILLFMDAGVSAFGSVSVNKLLYSSSDVKYLLKDVLKILATDKGCNGKSSMFPYH